MSEWAKRLIHTVNVAFTQRDRKFSISVLMQSTANCTLCQVRECKWALRPYNCASNMAQVIDSFTPSQLILGMLQIYRFWCIRLIPTLDTLGYDWWVVSNFLFRGLGHIYKSDASGPRLSSFRCQFIIPGPSWMSANACPTIFPNFRRFGIVRRTVTSPVWNALPAINVRS